MSPRLPMLAAVFLMIGTGLWTSLAGNPAVPPSGELSVPAEAVIGLPVPVRLLVHGEAEVVETDLFDATSPVGLRLVSADRNIEFGPNGNRRVLKRMASEGGGYGDAGARADKLHVAPDGSQEFVWDLSHLDSRTAGMPGGAVGFRSALPGAYALTVLDSEVPVENALPITVAQATLNLAAPNEAEQTLIKRMPSGRLLMRPSAARAFVLGAPKALEGIDTSLFSATGKKQMQYLLLLARLVHDPAPIGDLTIQPSEVEGIWTAYETEVWILNYEIQARKGDEAAATALRAQILQRRPLEAQHLDYVRDHWGTIADFRSNLAP